VSPATVRRLEAQLDGATSGEDVLMSLADELLWLVDARSFGVDVLRDLRMYRAPSSQSEIESVERLRYAPIRMMHGYQPIYGAESQDRPAG
jgi:hypothetical protein